MDLALNNLQRLICHKTKQTKPSIKVLNEYVKLHVCMFHSCKSFPSSLDWEHFSTTSERIVAKIIEITIFFFFFVKWPNEGFLKKTTWESGGRAWVLVSSPTSGPFDFMIDIVCVCREERPNGKKKLKTYSAACLLVDLSWCFQNSDLALWSSEGDMPAVLVKIMNSTISPFHSWAGGWGVHSRLLFFACGHKFVLTEQPEATIVSRFNSVAFHSDMREKVLDDYVELQSA